LNIPVPVSFTTHAPAPGNYLVYIIMALVVIIAVIAAVVAMRRRKNKPSKQ